VRLCVLALSVLYEAEAESEDAFSWFVALVALGLTIWTDLVTSLLVGSFVLARWLHPRGFSKKTMLWGRTITAVTIAVWAIPFAIGLPGAVRASKDLGWPFHASSSSLSAFEQISAIAFGIFGFVDRPSLFPLTLFVLFAVIAIRWTRTATALGLALMFATLTAASSYIAMRTRNVVFLPMALAFVASLVAARAPIDAIREKVRNWRSR